LPRFVNEEGRKTKANMQFTRLMSAQKKRVGAKYTCAPIKTLPGFFIQSRNKLNVKLLIWTLSEA